MTEWQLVGLVAWLEAQAWICNERGIYARNLRAGELIHGIHEKDKEEA